MKLRRRARCATALMLLALGGVGVTGFMPLAPGSKGITGRPSPHSHMSQNPEHTASPFNHEHTASQRGWFGTATMAVRADKSSSDTGRGKGPKRVGGSSSSSGGAAERRAGNRANKDQELRETWKNAFGPSKDGPSASPSAAAPKASSASKPKAPSSSSSPKASSSSKAPSKPSSPSSSSSPNGLPPPPKLSKATTKNPALKLLLERYPDLMSKSTEQLEQDLDAKFDKAIRTKGQEYYFSEEDLEERARAEARLSPMTFGDVALLGPNKDTSTVLRQPSTLASPSSSSMPLTLGDIDELSEAEMSALGLELDLDIEEDEEDLLDDEEEDSFREGQGMLESGEGAGGLESRTFFKLRPPPVMVPESEAGQLGWAGTKPLKQAQAAADKRGKASSSQQQELLMNGDRPASGPSREGGDLRFRRNNLFALTNMQKDGSLLDERQTFVSLGLTRPGILHNLQAQGFTTPTNIQALAFPLLLHGRSAVLHSYTGSGKTLAYLLPLLQRVDPDFQAIQLVILAPSRELATQIAQVVNMVADGTGVTCVPLIGGAATARQIEKLRQERPQVIVGTPGRVAELVLDKRKAKVGAASMVVLDEVDELLDASYLGDVRMLLGAMPRLSQSVFASATGSSAGVMALASEMIKGPYDMIKATAGSKGPNKAGIELPRSLRHGLFIAPPAKLVDALRRFLHTEPHPEGVMVFVNDATKVKGIVDYLKDKGVDAAGLHGDSSKTERALTISRLVSGQLTLVVSTDVSARGIDVPSLTHVVNLDLPSSVQQYVHRAGRCGRAGRPGIVLSLSPPSTSFVLSKFAKQLDIEVERVDIAHNRLILYDEGQLPPLKPKTVRAPRKRAEDRPPVAQEEGEGEGEEEE